MFDKPRILTSSEGWITPIASWCATAEEREGALSCFDGSRIVRDLQNRSARHDLISLYEVATGRELYPAQYVGDNALVDAIVEALSAGKLLLVPRSTPGSPDAGRARVNRAVSATEEGRLVAAVMGDRRSLQFEGNKYRFVVLDGLSYRSTGREEFRPIPAAQARELLERMSEQLARTPEQRASWQRLADKVTDWRSGARVVLTCNAPAPGGVGEKIDAPVVTPSQARALVAEQYWIEIKIEHEDGSPYDGNCLLELPGGRTTAGAPNAGGVVRVDGIEPGTCKVSFPDVDTPASGPGAA